MFADVQTPAFENTARSPQRYAGGHGMSVQTSRPSGGDAAPAANGKPISCLTLRRGPQLMVVFQGCPHPSVVQSLRQAQVMIGLALSPNDLKTVSRLDSYSYVLVSSRSHAKSALAQAVSELTGANWSIDDTTAWPSPDTGVGSSMAWLNTQPQTDWQSLGTS